MEAMFSRIQSVHFVGICGTAMASAAAAMQEKGVKVTGSDQNVYPPMSTFLAERKIEVISGYAEQNLAHKPDLVVIGNAISRGNPEAEYVLDHKLPYCSLPELLKHFFIRGKRSLVVTGTHGKTTTTALLTWVFEHNGLNPSYLIGGIPNNLGQGARFTDSEWFIIEGDEYDTAFFDKRSKFVHYLPEVAIINNLEFDHADIFESLEAIKTAFKHFIRLIPRNGLLLGNGDDANLAPLLNVTHCPVKRFGLGEGNAVQAFNIRYGPTATEFEIPSFKFHTNFVGELNVRNALAVVALRQALRPQEPPDPGRLRHLQRHQAPHGSARHRGRRDGGGRLRPSSHRDSRDLARAAHQVSHAEGLGHLRAAHQHDPAQCLPGRAGRAPLPTPTRWSSRKWPAWNCWRPKSAWTPSG